MIDYTLVKSSGQRYLGGLHYHDSEWHYNRWHHRWIMSQRRHHGTGTVVTLWGKIILVDYSIIKTTQRMLSWWVTSQWMTSWWKHGCVYFRENGITAEGIVVGSGHEGESYQSTGREDKWRGKGDLLHLHITLKPQFRDTKQITSNC